MPGEVSMAWRGSMAAAVTLAVEAEQSEHEKSVRIAGVDV